jgi:hypothetical protein
MKILLAAALLAGLAAPPAAAQENYEIQVYPSKTADPGTTLFELHSNYTGAGSRFAIGSVLPTNGALHETLEITHGFNDVFELGFYFFTSEHSGTGYHYVGSHIRPRIRAPESWGLPVGLSLSTEIGFADKKYDSNELSVEFRPIIDQQVGAFYWSLNPVVGWSMKGPEAGTGAKGMMFTPNVKLAWTLNPKIAAGIEYYGETGSIVRMAASADQQHMIYPSIDLFLSEDWEFNAGYGIQVAGNGDHNILKVIVGRRFGW